MSSRERNATIMSNLPSQNNTTDKDLHVLDILNEMRRAGLESAFIFSLMEHCQKYEGIRDLMEMWLEETNIIERDKYRKIIYRLLSYLQYFFSLSSTLGQHAFSKKKYFKKFFAWL